MHPPPANLYSRIRSMMGFSSEPSAPPSTTSTTTTVLSSPCTQTCFAGDVHVLLEAAVKLQNRNRTIAGLAPFPIPSKTQTLPIWRQRSDGPSGLERVAKTIGIAIHVYPLPTPTAYLPSPVSYLPDSAPDTLAEVVFVAGGPDLAPPYRLLVPEDLVLRSRVDVQGLRKVSNPLLGRCSDSATPSADPTPPTDRAAPATPHATPHPPTPRTAPVVSPFAPHVNISLHEFKQLFDAFAEHQRLANDKRALRGEHDPRRTTAILSQRLIKLAHDMKLPVDTKVVLVVGDQTVGKSTFIMSLQERVMLLQDSATGTRFRTFIRSEFDPSLDKDAEVADFSYTNVERGIHENRRGLTPLQLFDLSDEVSRGPNPRGLKSYWDKAGVDGNGMAEMVMRHGGTSIGVSIIDHPGIKRADAYGKPDTIKATESSLREHFPDSGKSNGVVLITYSAVSDPSQHSWQDVDFKPLVKNGRSGEDLYVGITKFNLLTLTDLARLVRSEGREDGVTLTEVIDMVSKQLLDTLDDMGLKPKRVFLLPGSSEDTPVLRKIQNDRERLETFLESERKNTESIIKRLLDRDAWEKEGITITSDPDEDVAMLVDRIGVRHARREFQRLQRRAFVEVSKEVAASVRKELQQLRARQMALDASASLESAYEDEVVNFFLSVGSIFGTMASSQPYSEETADVLAEMEKEPEYGFTLADFERLLAELPHRSEFPRDEFRIDNYDVVFDDLIKRTISDDNRMPNLPSLINIIKYMWAIRCQLIEPPDVDPQDVLDRSASTTRVSVKNTLERLAAESTRHYRDLYASKGGKTGGGFAYVSQYAATAFVMQADLVLQLLFRSGKFERLLPERVDLLAEVPKMTVSAMSSKPQSNEYKLSSMSGRPIEDLWPSVLESLHKHADVEGGALARLQRDLRRVLVSQYFDEPYDMVLSNLEQQGRALTDQHTPQYPTLMQFGHLFVHQDPSFMDLFAQARPTSAFSQTFLHKRAGTEPAVPLHPDISTPEDIKLYLWLSQEWRDAAASTMRVPPAGPAERADFLVSTLRLVDMPDVALMQQSEDRTDATFAQSLKYVHRRTMSAANFETWRVGDRLLTSSLSAYISRSTMPRFQQKMIDSFLSLLLGFGHPYSEFKRPNSLRAQLDPAQVIRVLYNERHIFGSPNGTLSARACYLSSSPIMQAYIARYMATLHNDEDAVAFVSDYNPRHSLADIVDSIEDLHALLLRAEDKDAASTDFDLGKDYENINLPKVNNQADQLRLRLLHLLFKLRYPVAVLGREEEERRTRLAALVRELSELQARLDPFARYVDDNQEELSKDMQEPLPSSTPGFPAPDEDVLVEPAHADSEPVLAPSVADSYEG